MFALIGSILTAFFITYFAIPSIIKVAEIKNLNAEPKERSSHTIPIPTLGGIGIFAGLIFSITYWIQFEHAPAVQYILCAYIVIFLVGAKDDIIPLPASKKLIGQLVAAGLLVAKSNIKLTSLYGIFGIYAIPDLLSLPLTVFVILLIINAFNLIDGINGLAATITIICCGTYGYWFYGFGRLDLAILAAALVGALIAFLQYNLTPARIFMGDTGSLLVGLTVSILTINFIESNKVWHSGWIVQSVPAVAVGILIVPLFDTLKVFTMRILKGKSPFNPDKTHIHHILINTGLSHLQATTVLAVVNFVFIGLAFSLQHIGTLPLLFVLLVSALALVLLAIRLEKK